MSRDGFSRLLLVLLAIVGLVAGGRLLCGSGEPDALVSFGDDLDAHELHRRAFVLERPARVAIYAAGSFESDTTLAAYGWLVRTPASGEPGPGEARGGEADAADPVWVMRPARPTRGTFAEVRDTVLLPAGRYDAYFAAYGDPAARQREDRSLGGRARAFFTRDGRAWLGDASRWRFRLDPADADADVADLVDYDDLDEAPADLRPGLVWASGPVESREEHEFLFEVRAPVRLHVRVTGEVDGGAVADGATLERLGDGVVWAMTAGGTRWAGGSLRNRRADTTLALTPGLYRATYRTDDRHAYDDWLANPPFRPDAWGVALAVADPAQRGAVGALDPWASLPRIVSFACVGNDALEERTFTLPDTTLTLLVATGELIGSSTYDYAWLTRDGEAGTPPEEVYAMSTQNTRPAGGASKNRLAETALTLAPGTYTLHYQTDDSHACGDFNDDEPLEPERWGATLFALESDFDLGTVRFTAGRKPGVPAAAGAERLADLTGLGNATTRAAAFTLDEPASLHLYAVGELVLDERLDYGWITDGAGRTVWEMTRENTAWAGGSKKNRVFDGTIDLPAGAYTVHFRTNESHAYGAFGQPAPTDPSAWGIRVDRRPPAGSPAEGAPAEAPPPPGVPDPDF